MYKNNFCRLWAVIGVALVCLFALLGSGRAQNTGFDEKGRLWSQGQAKISLSCALTAEGYVEITLGLDSDSGLCGLIGELEFDGEAFTLVECLRGDGGADVLNFSTRVYENKVAFLFDGAQNSEPCCKLARFLFESADSSGGAYEFLLHLQKDRSAFLFDSSGRLCVVKAEETVSETVVVLGGGAGLVQSLPPKLSGASLVLREEGATVKLCGESADGQRLAVGFMIFVVDLEGVGVARVGVSRMVSDREYEMIADVPRFDRMCMIITPVIYGKGGVTEGQKQAFVFVDGKLQ